MIRNDSIITQGSRDDVHLVHHSVAFSNSSSVFTIKTNGMDFINERESSILVGNVAKLLERWDGPAHRVDSLESDDLRKSNEARCKLWAKMIDFGFSFTFGMFGSTLDKSSSKCLGSLCRNMCLGTPLLRIPCIIEAWFPASEKMWQPDQLEIFRIFTKEYLKMENQF